MMDETPTQQNTETPDIPAGLRRCAQIFSDIFSPILISTYGMVIAMTMTTLSMLPAGIRLGATIGVAFITAFIPALFIFILIRMGKVSDTDISDRHQRTAPFLAAALCYIGAAIYVSVLHAPRWLMLFFAAAATLSLISLLITRRWKISAHSGASAGLAGVIFWLGANHILLFQPLAMISGAILLTGILASSRIILGRHTLMQVVAGALLGFFIEYGTLILFA